MIEGRRDRAKQDHEAAEAKAKREADAVEAEAQRKHDARVARRAERVNQIREWREGLAAAHADYRKWDASTRGRSTVPGHLAVEPNIASVVWFQSLRRHLLDGGATNDYRSPTYYRNSDDIECDDYAADVLGREIGRVEQEWLDD